MRRASKEPVLAAEGLVMTYPKAAAPAVGGIDVTVGEAEIFGLLGPNGAGKTTAISIMSTLLRPDGGQITICGVDALRHPRRARKLIGVIPQDIALYGSLTARENLRYFGRLYGMRGQTLERRIDECLEMVALQDNGDRQVRTFSGGMKRRINLAVGVLHEPKLLFLDEPTVGIDAQSRSLILDNLQSLRAAGMSMVYTTHYMEEAQQYCTSLAVIDGGRIIASGKAEELIERTADCFNLEDVFLHLTGRHLRD
ncbi:MAG: ABC transporter ATP-binding protein [Gammaproteobacteria bacterium]|nr:ABC transporter ATP-binding protein [Desulfuromonadales bacterium]NIT64863.1 ABC transporter ATP-binding protein [Gammaproteobacteria bacterium]NIY33443.1 ATP-binding cassette domain-containing protein [Gammaproteobacteria bacterium]